MAQHQESPAPPAISPRGGLVLVYAALMLAILLAALDQTIVSTALPTIVGDLGGLNHLSWVITAYLLAGAATCVVLLTSWGGTTFAWRSPVIIGLGIAAVALGSGWWWSARTAAEPVLPLRLFRNPVFSVSSAIGFAMFGALAFLPIYLQVVRGVSPTISGVYLLPMVLGLLLTSVASGQIISRWGRYKVFPIAGTALLTLGLFLLSRLSGHTPGPVMDAYFFVLGAGLGLTLQVLIIAVQNSADYADLGAATSGVTFFRSIGGSFGVAIFGSIFANRLASQIAAALHGVSLPAGVNPAAAEASPAILARLPAGLRADILHAYTVSIDTVFLAAVPVAAVGFVLSWFLREVPLRSTAGAADLGEGIGAAPAQRSSVQEVERALCRLADADMRRRGYERLAARAGLDLPGGSCWVLTRLARQGTVPGEELARQANVTVDHGRPYVDALVTGGLVVRADGMLDLTPAGGAAADRLFAARREALCELLQGFDPEQHADLAAMLSQLSRALLGDDADRQLLSR